MKCDICQANNCTFPEALSQLNRVGELEKLPCSRNNTGQLDLDTTYCGALRPHEMAVCSFTFPGGVFWPSSQVCSDVPTRPTGDLRDCSCQKMCIPRIITHCLYKWSMKVTHGFYGRGALEAIFEWHWFEWQLVTFSAFVKCLQSTLAICKKKKKNSAVTWALKRCAILSWRTGDVRMLLSGAPNQQSWIKVF